VPPHFPLPPPKHHIPKNTWLPGNGWRVRVFVLLFLNQGCKIITSTHTLLKVPRFFFSTPGPRTELKFLLLPRFVGGRRLQVFCITLLLAVRFFCACIRLHSEFTGGYGFSDLCVGRMLVRLHGHLSSTLVCIRYHPPSGCTVV